MSDRGGRASAAGGQAARRSTFPSRKHSSIALLIVVVLSIYILTLFTDTTFSWKEFDNQVFSEEQLESLAWTPKSRDASPKRQLRIFMPADSPHINLCKTIVSSVALGYPLPTLLNWEGEFNHPDWQFSGSHIAKLESLLSAIEHLLDHQEAGEDDIALLTDAHDVWFQLPPSVLIDRFHALNERADERVREEWARLPKTNSHFPVGAPRQNIVVTTAKDCGPDAYSGSYPHYAHWPKSPVREDLYGDGTDEMLHIWDPARRYRKIRPRCVNSGMIMGTMGALRATLRRAKEKVEAISRDGRQLWSDQGLLAEVIGDQEMWREWMRTLASTWNGTNSVNALASLAPEVRAIAVGAVAEGREYEFGIGLDYEFLTMPPTCSAEEDSAFVRLNDAESVRQESEKAGVMGQVRVTGIPEDLSHRKVRQSYPHEISWGDVPLFTDMYFGKPPVAIHHNAYVGGLKSIRIREWWDKMWFHPMLRDLVTVNWKRMTEGEQKIGEREMAVSQKGGVVEYHSAALGGITIYKPGAEQGEILQPVGLGHVCQAKGSKPWHEVIFGDGKGPLV